MILKDKLIIVILLSILFISCIKDSEKKEITFERKIEILKKVDDCPSGQNKYSRENTSFYTIDSLQASYLLVETGIGCGFTGSCGNRLLIIKEDSIVWETCGFLDEFTNSTTFFILNRGYQAGVLKSKVFLNDNKYDDEIISRNNIPIRILDQLPLSDCSEQDYFYDCYTINDLKIDTIFTKNYGESILISGPNYIFKEDNSEIESSFIFSLNDHQLMFKN